MDDILGVYEFPANVEVPLASAFFHHERDASPTAVTADYARTVFLLRPLEDWHTAKAATHLVLGSPLDLPTVELQCAGHTAAISAVRKTTHHNKHGHIEFAASDLADLADLDFCSQAQLLRVEAPGGSATALLDASAYGKGTYVLYLGSSALLTLEVDEAGKLVGGHYQEAPA